MLAEMRGQGLNDQEISRRFLEAMQIPDVEKILQAPPPQPDPKVQLDQQKLQLEQQKFQFEQHKFRMEYGETIAKIKKLGAQAMEHIAKAEGVEPGRQIEQYKANVDSLAKQEDLRLKKQQLEQQQQAAKQQGGASGNKSGSVGPASS